MTVNSRPVKRIKFRVRADLCDVFAFASSTPDQPYTAPFRINVRQFLSRHARLVAASGLDGMMTWQMNISVSQPRRATSDPSVLTLEVVEEDVARCWKIYCDHCRVVGWGRHPVCAKRYHFIIRNSDSQFKVCPRLCIYCGSTLDLSESSNRCLSCNHKIDVESLQEQEYSRIEDAGHLLHGIVHSNGYGHLVRINGLEGGSQIVNLCDLMDFWDRLCRLLRVRKITVTDISNKQCRLLHAIIHGHPWYGKWGYEFGTGSFGLTIEAYREALKSLSTEPLSLIFSNSRSPRSQLQNTIAFYQFLSDKPLVTVRDLLCFICSLLGCQTQKSKALSIVQEQALVEPCTWSAEDIRSSFDKILKVLRAANAQQWVSWQNLKGATSRSVGSIELLKYCLKHLNGKTTEDGKVVAMRRNKETGSVEYSLRLEAAVKNYHGSQVALTYKPSKVHILNDLKYLYNALLNPQTMHGYNPMTRLDSARLSATKLLNSKHLIKHYDKADDFSISNSFLIQITCNIEPVDHYKDSICPPEILILPVTATVSDLKVEAAKAFQEIYLIYQNFEADQLLDCKVASETTQVKLLFGSRGNALIDGRCYGGRRKLGIYRMERGVEKWMVDCVCGAKDDDGERMLACDVCSVWQHTRCSNIKDAQDVPIKFVCRMCNIA
ncbi:PHD finger protein [Rhynchospora pubera]|uniref:PHD finger protein n=1 Tax=Rhynchospora pubera TaxID=906938 RepID=A0AAV8FT88_9POAL|nr:PHD finger protein [Rhynchospora pubera]